MKQSITVFSIGLTVLSAIAFSGCNQDDDLPTIGDLSISSQVPMTRSSGEQVINPDPNKLTRNGENECGIMALVDLQRELHGSFGTGSNTKTADQFYDKLKKDAETMEKEDGTPWNYKGGFMDLELFLQVGKKNELLSERKNFSNNDEKHKFFEDKNNTPKIILIDKMNEKTGMIEQHVAHITYINRKKGTVNYSGVNKAISINEIKSVWN